mmetsp:Transcript_15082/g.26888  ORF Transcript_15082/g.26888 Transcript_15082/m.26888 type:complete len:284 (-) Transcript_15082:2954-3805(-)
MLWLTCSYMCMNLSYRRCLTSSNEMSTSRDSCLAFKSISSVFFNRSVTLSNRSVAFILGSIFSNSSSRWRIRSRYELRTAGRSSFAVSCWSNDEKSTFAEARSSRRTVPESELLNPRLLGSELCESEDLRRFSAPTESDVKLSSLLLSSSSSSSLSSSSSSSSGPSSTSMASRAFLLFLRDFGFLPTMGISTWSRSASRNTSCRRARSFSTAFSAPVSFLMSCAFTISTSSQALATSFASICLLSASRIFASTCASASCNDPRTVLSISSASVLAFNFFSRPA